jgi:hypothetical protein
MSRHNFGWTIQGEKYGFKRSCIITRPSISTELFAIDSFNNFAGGYAVIYPGQEGSAGNTGTASAAGGRLPTFRRDFTTILGLIKDVLILSTQS